MSKQPKPAGFGSPFWARRVLDAMHLYSDLAAATIEPVLGELMAQTRLDEAMACLRAGGEDRGEHEVELNRRIAEHRRDLRAAKRRAK